LVYYHIGSVIYEISIFVYNLDTAAGWEMDGWMGKTELVAS